MKRLLAITLCGASLSACAYQAPVAVTPNLNVYSSYEDKLPGTYVLYVSSEGFNQTIKPTGYQCAAHSFPLDMGNTFKASVVKTMQQLVENLEIVDSPISVEELMRTGKKGMIVVRADNIDARIQFVPGFVTGTAISQVELSANMTVDSKVGRILGTTADGNGNAQSDSGAFCGGGANAVADAADKAMKQLLGQLGERLSNSPRLRAESQSTESLSARSGGSVGLSSPAVASTTAVAIAAPPTPTAKPCAKYALKVATDSSQSVCAQK